MMMRKFFLKRFKSFFLIMLLPLLILSMLVLGFQSRSSCRFLIGEASNSLTRVNDSLSNAVSTSAYQYELLTYNPRLVLSLKKFFQHETFSYSDVVLLNSIDVMLGSVAQAHDFIASIYLYLDGFEDFFSTEEGFLSISQSIDKDWYDKYQAMPDGKRLWITARTFQPYSFVPSTEYITVYQRMGNIEGTIVVNIDQEKFRETLDTSTSLHQEYLYFLDSEGRILNANSAAANAAFSFSDYLAGLSASGEMQASSLTEMDASWISYGKHICYLKILYNPDYDVFLAALIPLSYVFSSQIGSLLLLFGSIVCIAIITLFLAYRTTKRNFWQIDHLIQTFDQAEKGILPPKETAARDEYDVILSNVIHVFLKSTHLQQQLREKQYQQELAEKTALQLQINPHFLFNTLQTLDFEALRLSGKPGILNIMLHDLSDILKYSLDDTEKPVTLGDELNYLKKYVEIQKQRYGDRIVIYYEVDEALLNMRILRLILQPLVENSISHGIAALDRTGYVKVRIYRQKDLVFFVVIDSGIGLEKEELRRLYTQINDEKSKNIGLTNVNRRLILQYGESHALRLQSKKGMGMCVSFTVPAPQSRKKT